MRVLKLQILLVKVKVGKGNRYDVTRVYEKKKKKEEKDGKVSDAIQKINL